MTDGINRKVVIAGVGYSEIGRSTGRSEASLAFEACTNAINDAGLTPSQIDGMSAWPDRPPAWSGRIGTPFDGPPMIHMQRALGLKNLRYFHTAGLGTNEAQLGAFMASVYTIAGGGASAVLTYRAHVREATAAAKYSHLLSHDEEAFTQPFGAAGAPHYSMWANRHMYEFGTKQEHLGAVVTTARYHATLNPRAVWRDNPLSMEEYLASRDISTPFKIHDCDYPVDGALAFVLMSAERAKDLPHKPVYIESLGHAAGPVTDFDQWRDVTEMNSAYAAKEMWSKTSLKPSDVDIAEVYDGFSWLSICWLEDLGFFKKGEAGPFLLEGGGRIDGALPICTDGGMLGMGRMHGYTKPAAAALQLRGEGGAHQVKKKVEVAIASAGGGNVGSCMILTV